MKKIYFLFFFLLNVSVFGQGFINQFKIWNIFEMMIDAGWTFTYKVSGDTTINSVQYKKLVKTFDTVSTSTSNWEYVAGLREEVSNKKVFIIVNGVESLLYDFDLNTGDTYHFSSCMLNATVASTDSVIYMDGIKRKRIKFDDTYQTTWVEGIGSVTGINEFVIFGCNNGPQELVCYWEDGNQVYKSQTYSSCFPYYWSIEERNKSEVKIYPNPAFETIHIEINEQIEKVSILTTKGNWKNVEINSDGLINVSNLNSGVYMLNVITKSKCETHRLVILK